MPEQAPLKSRTKLPSKEGSGKYVQEKIMIGLGLVFFGGVLAQTLIPEPYNGAAMSLISCLALLVMFRFN